MKRHSKLIVLLVALTFLFSIAAPAMAADAEKSTQKLMSLGIVSGDPDGDLRLDDTITRAEFAKIAVLAAGLESAADVLASAPSEFSDVKADAWYTGYINVASSQGYVKGDGDGTFRPNDDISGAEVATVLLRLLGYNDNLPGTWPTDYIVKAASLEITKGISFGANVPAVRGDVFAMADATLNTEKTEWDADKEKFVEQADKLIADSFEGSMEKGLVTDVEWNKGNISVDIDGTKVDVADSVTFVGASDFVALLGSKIDYVLNDDDEIVYAAVKDTDSVSKNKMVISDTESNLNIDKEDYDIAAGFGITAYPDDTAIAVADGTFDTADEYVVVLNKDGEAQWAFAYDYSAGDIVDEIDDDTLFAQFGGFSNYEYDEDDDVVVVRNGAVASFEDIKAGDLVYVYEVRGLDALIIASDAALEADLEGYNADKDEITVDGEDYDLDGDAIVSSDGGDAVGSLISDMIDESIEVRLSPLGFVAVAISDVEEESSDLYGIVLEGYEGKVNEVKILTGEGTKVWYDLESDSKLTVTDNATIFVTDNGAGVAGYSAAGALVSYKLNDDGEVKEIVSIATSDTTNDSDGNRIQWDDNSWDRIARDVAIFVDSSDWDTATWAAFTDTVDAGNNVNYVIDGNEVVAIAYTGAISSDSKHGVIAGSGYNSDGFYYDILVDGESVRYNTIDGDAPDDASVGSEVYSKKTYTYFTLSDGEFDAAAATYIEEATAEAGGAEVTKVEADYFKTSTYYDINDDTIIIDITGSSPKVASRIARGDYVYVPVGSADSKGVLDIVLIVSQP